MDMDTLDDHDGSSCEAAAAPTTMAAAEAATTDFSAIPDHVIFDNIITWIPVYPFLFAMRRVCKQWQQSIELAMQHSTKLDLLIFDHANIGAHECYPKYYDLTRNWRFRRYLPNITRLKIHVGDYEAFYKRW
jgi:hypothetical protein